MPCAKTNVFFSLEKYSQCFSRQGKGDKMTNYKNKKGNFPHTDVAISRFMVYIIPGSWFHCCENRNQCLHLASF